jgi:hypothetical protein
LKNETGTILVPSRKAARRTWLLDMVRMQSQAWIWLCDAAQAQAARATEECSGASVLMDAHPRPDSCRADSLSSLRQSFVCESGAPVSRNACRQPLRFDQEAAARSRREAWDAQIDSLRRDGNSSATRRVIVSDRWGLRRESEADKPHSLRGTVEAPMNEDAGAIFFLVMLFGLFIIFR